MSVECQQTLPGIADAAQSPESIMAASERSITVIRQILREFGGSPFSMALAIRDLRRKLDS